MPGTQLRVICRPCSTKSEDEVLRTSVFWDVGSVYSDKCYLSTTQGCDGVDLGQINKSQKRRITADTQDKTPRLGRRTER